MSTGAISNSVSTDLKSYFQQRNFDMHNLGQMLKSGDLQGAQQAFEAMKTLGQNGPFANGDTFKMNQREHAFEAVGQALQSGDLDGAQEAFKHLVTSFRMAHRQPVPVAAANSKTDAAASKSTLDVSA